MTSAAAGLSAGAPSFLSSPQLGPVLAGPVLAGPVLAGPAGPELTQSLRHAPLSDPPERLQDDAVAHLAGAVLAFHERNRHLDDLQPGLRHPHGEVDLEAVPGRLDLVQADRAQGRGPVGPEPRGRVADL